MVLRPSLRLGFRVLLGFSELGFFKGSLGLQVWKGVDSGQQGVGSGLQGVDSGHLVWIQAQKV
jgi:hypothetical protein